MKRSALKRKAGLKRGGYLRRGRRKPVGVIVADIWREGLHDEKCVVCGTRRGLDGHHAIPRRVLIRLGFVDYVMDKRNRVPTCRHDHESHETRHRPIRRDELPASVFDFAAELGLEWYLDRHYPGWVPAIAVPPLPPVNVADGRKGDRFDLMPVDEQESA